MKTRQGWSELEVKTKIAYITAIIAFALGWALTIAGFVIGAGIISDSVLWVLGQALVYAASVLGIGMYVTGSVKHMKQAIRSFMVAEDRKIKSGEIFNEDEELDDGEVQD